MISRSGPFYKFLLVVLLVIVAGIGVYSYLEKSSAPVKEGLNKKEVEETVETKIENSKGASYDIFGGSEFKTAVEGYLEVKDKEGFEGEKNPTAFLVITKFYNEKFKESIEKGIDEGNTVNIKENGKYKFNLGCFKNGSIQGIEYKKGTEYIDDSTMQAILNSTPEKPVKLELYFTEHLGTGCVCCNLAYKIRVQN